jgi:kynurenine formamidase
MSEPAAHEAIEPATGLRFVELSHPWGHGAPVWPGDHDVRIERVVNHATHGVMAQKLTMSMHSGTHLNAPVHLIQGGADVASLGIERFFGNGVVLSLPKKSWGLVTDKDLDKAKPAVQTGDIVIVDTGWHEKYSDSQDYFGRAPGLSKKAAEWLVAKKVALVGIDTAAIDHPLATSLGPHRNGPLMKRLPKLYETETGRNPKKDHPEWNAAHKVLLRAGIPTIENVGGGLSQVSGKRCTFHAYPWKWVTGDACAIRLMAIVDPGGKYRIERGS